MRLLVADHPGHPFQYELSREIAKAGHVVVHSFCASTDNPSADFSDPYEVVIEPIVLRRGFVKYSLLGRLRSEVEYGWRTARLIRSYRISHVVVSNMPLVSLAILWGVAACYRARRVLWLQDIQSGLIHLVRQRMGMMERASVVLEKFLVARSDHVVVISQPFADVLSEWAIPRDQVTVIENWAPIDEIPFFADCSTPWASEHGLDGQFLFLYSGTLGKKHDPRKLMLLAHAFADDPATSVVVVGGGAGFDWLCEQPEPRPILLPYQPYAQVPEVLGAGEVLIVLLDGAAGEFSVPSKTLSYLCAGRPILGSLPEQNLSARLIGLRAGAGIVTSPSDDDGFVNAAMALRSDSSLRKELGASGRRYATANFDIDDVATRFLSLLDPSDAMGRTVC